VVKQPLPANAAGVLRFGPFALDLTREQVLHNDAPVPLRRKVREVLHYLLRRPNRVVTIDELLDELWPGLAVTPHSVTAAIGPLRKLLERDAATTCRIESVYGRGYRFVVARSPSGAAGDSANPANQNSSEPAAHDADCVGRDAARANLLREWKQARAGRSRQVLLAGDAGHGKTTLLRWLAKEVANEVGAIVLQAACTENSSEAEPFQPLLSMFAAFENQLGAAALTTHLRSRAPTWLLQFPHLVSEQELTRFRSLLIGSHPGRVRRELMALLTAIGIEHPLLLIVDDIHWADSSTLDWLGDFVMTTAPMRVLLIASYRPLEAAIGAAPQLRDLRRQVAASPSGRLQALDPWSPTEISAYLKQRFATDFGAGFVAATERQSAGSPLFVAALMDSMVKAGQIQRQDGEWSYSSPSDTSLVHWPEQIRELIRQQFTRLAAEDRELLEAASVLGNEFFGSHVATVCGLDENQTMDRLADLCDARAMITQATTRTSLVGDYSFLHDQYRQSVLKDMPRARLVALLQRISETLAATGVANVSNERLADGFAQAGIWDKAADYWERAAQRNVQRFAYRDGTECLARACAAIERLPGSPAQQQRLAARLLDLGNVTILAVGYTTRAADSFLQARGLAQQCGAALLEFRARSGECASAAMGSDPQSALQHAKHLRSAAEERPAWRSMAHLYSAYAFYQADQFEDVIEHADSGLRWLPQAAPGMPALRDLASSLMGMRIAGLSRGERGNRCRSAMNQLAAQLPLRPVDDMHAYYVLARSAIWIEEYTLAESWALACRQQAIELADPEFGARSEAMTLMAAFKLRGGDLQDVAAAIERCRATSSTLDRRFFQDWLAAESAPTAPGRP